MKLILHLKSILSVKYYLHGLLMFIGIVIFKNTIYAQQNIYSRIKEAGEEWKQDPENYLAPINYFSGNTDSLSKGELSFYYEMMYTYNSFVCDYESTLEIVDKRLEGRKTMEIDTQTLQDHIPMSAKSIILDKADSTNIILINESHHIPYHRVFVMELLEELRNKGYSHLAMETFEGEDYNNDFPQFKDGYYLREPLFAEMIRKAIKLGFELVEYESKEKCDRSGKEKYFCSNYRDSIQADNIYKIFEEQEDAKVLVYAGYSHIKETYEGGTKRMGYYLNRKNLNPLSIDQTKMNLHLDPEREHGIYKGVKKTNSFETPIVMVDKNNTPWSYTDRIDMMIFHPKLKKDEDRFSFYSINNERIKYKVNTKNYEDSSLLIQAFYKNEKSTSRIPADQIIFKEEDKSNFLFLYPNEYELVIRNLKGEILDSKFISVK